MNMTLKEMLLQVNDRLAYIEEKVEYNNVAMANLMESVTLLAESLRDFFDGDLPEPPTMGIKIPLATSGNLFEKLNDPIFMKEFSNNIKKETEKLMEFEDELEKIQDQIVKGKVGEA